jgi:hypothetical protein
VDQIFVLKNGVAEKHNFCAIQRKIPQISNFAQKRDSNPPPHGDTAADIAKMFAKFFLQKSDFGSKNMIFAIIRSDFCKIPRTLSRKSDSAKNFFPIFAIFPLPYDFRKKTVCKNWIPRKTFLKICVFRENRRFFAKNT